MVIPLAAPTRLGAAEAAAVRAAVDGVLAGARWVLGPAVAAFEEAFGEYVGAAHVVGVGNGSDALGIAFVALGLEPGDGVLVPPNLTPASPRGAARSVGLVPVVMDVDPNTAGPSVGTAAAALRDGVRAVVATHLHGDPLDLSALDAWRRDVGLLLVEDCAQAHGARLAGRHVGCTWATPPPTASTPPRTSAPRAMPVPSCSPSRSTLTGPVALREYG